MPDGSSYYYDDAKMSQHFICTPFFTPVFYFKREGEGDGERERESTNMLTWKGACALKLTSIICLETAKPLG